MFCSKHRRRTRIGKRISDSHIAATAGNIVSRGEAEDVGGNSFAAKKAVGKKGSHSCQGPKFVLLFLVVTFSFTRTTVATLWLACNPSCTLSPATKKWFAWSHKPNTAKSTSRMRQKQKAVSWEGAS